MYIAARGGGPEGRTDPLAGTDSISPHSYPELFDDWYSHLNLMHVFARAT